MARWTVGDRTDLYTLLEGHSPSKILAKLIEKCAEIAEGERGKDLPPERKEECAKFLEEMRAKGLAK